MLRVRTFRQLVLATISFWTVTVLGLLAGGVSLVPALAASGSARQYQLARQCSGATDACYSFMTGTLTDVQVDTATRYGGCNVTVTSAIGRRREFMADPNDCKGLTTGQPVQLKVWRQQITALGPPNANALGRTTDNPVYIDQNDRTGVIFGFLIGAAGLVLSAILWWRYRWPGGPRLDQL